VGSALASKATNTQTRRDTLRFMDGSFADWAIDKAAALVVIGAILLLRACI
jgi:hypothetical protein